MFEEREFESWSDLKKFLSSLNSNWIFRGQGDYSWKLESSIDRVDINDKQRFEQYCLNDIKRNPHLYNGKYSVDSGFQTLSLLQHYGLPTRLLDFSLSQYVSTFFAVAESNSDCSIYALESMEMLKSTVKLFMEDYPIHLSEYHVNGSLILSNSDVFDGIVLGRVQIAFVDLVQPFFKFDRMVQQSGCFLVQGDINSSFEDNLKRNYNILQACKNRSPYYKLKIKRDWKEEVLRDLDRMNISYETIYPGMEGYLKSRINKFKFIEKDRGEQWI